MNFRVCVKCSHLYTIDQQDQQGCVFQCRGPKNEGIEIYVLEPFSSTPPTWCPKKLEHGVHEALYAK